MAETVAQTLSEMIQKENLAEVKEEPSKETTVDDSSWETIHESASTEEKEDPAKDKPEEDKSEEDKSEEDKSEEDKPEEDKPEEDPSEKEVSSSEENTEEENADEDVSEDDTCADEDCHCHEEEEPVRVEVRFQYFPPEINAFAMIVLFLHLLNAILQLSDRSQIQCFKRPY